MSALEAPASDASALEASTHALPFSLSDTFCTFANPLPFSGHGTLCLTSTDLTFALHPLPPSPPVATLSLSLSTISPSSLCVRTPLLRPAHVAGVADGAQFSLEPAADDAGNKAHKLLSLLRAAVGAAVVQREREGWVRRMIETAQKEEGGDREGVAFFDPKTPGMLVLAERMGVEEILEAAMARV